LEAEQHLSAEAEPHRVRFEPYLLVSPFDIPPQVIDASSHRSELVDSTAIEVPVMTAE
jgi:hypothetical protein